MHLSERYLSLVGVLLICQQAAHENWSRSFVELKNKNQKDQRTLSPNSPEISKERHTFQSITTAECSRAISVIAVIQKGSRIRLTFPALTLTVPKMPHQQVDETL